MRDSIEERLFHAIASVHVGHGGLVTVTCGSNQGQWSAVVIQGRYKMRKDPNNEVVGAQADLRSYDTVGALIDAFMGQIKLNHKSLDDAVFKQVRMTGEEPWGVTWRHLIARLDVLRMVLRDDWTIMDRIFEEAKNL